MEEHPYGVPMQNQLAFVLDSLGTWSRGVPGSSISAASAWPGLPRPAGSHRGAVSPRSLYGAPGERCTGPVIWCADLPDGNLELLGRIDNQVKIRSHRIELGRSSPR